MLVETLAEIEVNVDTLIRAIHSDSPDRTACIELVKKGAIYYPYQFGHVLAFAPSRFIGYKNNSIQLHHDLVATGVAHGTYTSARINSILGHQHHEDANLDAALTNYCLSLGVQVEAKKHKFWTSDRIVQSLISQSSAIDDLDDVGALAPERRQAIGNFFVRDLKVRRAVISRSNGKCEFCGELGFLKADGSRYVEAHHIIHLAKQGPDTLDNVIGLCPNHHREAHFGEGSDQLEAEFVIKLAKLRGH